MCSELSSVKHFPNLICDADKKEYALKKCILTNVCTATAFSSLHIGDFRSHKKKQVAKINKINLM